MQAKGPGPMSGRCAMNKQFLTYEQRIDLLHVRKLSAGERTPFALMHYGCYCIVNGCNAPFLDQAATAVARDGRFCLARRLRTSMHFSPLISSS